MNERCSDCDGPLYSADVPEEAGMKETESPDRRVDEIIDFAIQQLRESEAIRVLQRRAVAALRELVALHDGPRDADYERRKPFAWAAARRALDLVPPDVARDPS